MRRLVAVSFVLVALTASLLATPATADSMGSNRPVVTVVAGTPAGTAVTVTATINRTSKQIASCLYGVDAAPSIDCGAGAADGAGTRFTLTLLDQSPGEHTINSKIVLTDGGGATGSATSGGGNSSTGGGGGGGAGGAGLTGASMGADAADAPRKAMPVKRSTWRMPLPSRSRSSYGA